MRMFLFLTVSIICAVTAFGQKPKKLIKKLGNTPVIFIDSINVDYEELQKIEPTDVASVTVYKPDEAKDLLGEDGKDGAVYAFTKKYARFHYWQYFQKKSGDYKKLITSPESDTTVQYILNERVLKDNFEGDLFLIDDSVFKSIRLLTREELQTEFKVFNKTIGFQIKSDIPSDLYRGRKKF